MGPGGTWHGRPLTIIWIIETVIVYFWVISTVKTKVRMPFSEASQEWLKPDELPEKEFEERKSTIKRTQPDAEDAGKTKPIIKMNQPIAAEELINSLKSKGFKVSFEKYLRENPDPREVSYYEQSSVTIGSQRINLWSNSALYIEESNLVCLLAESASESWHYVMTIVNINSLEIESSRPRFHYQHEVEMIGSSKNMFTIKVKDELLHIDVSNFPEIKIVQPQREHYDIQIENTESKLTNASEELENTQPKTKSEFQELNRGTYCSIAGDVIISNAPYYQKRQMLISDILIILFYRGLPVKGHQSLYIIFGSITDKLEIEIGSKGYQDVVDLLFERFEIAEKEFYRLIELNDRFVLWCVPIEENFKILSRVEFKQDLDKGYELQTTNRLFLPWSTSREEILNNSAIPQLVKNNTPYFNCDIRFGNLIVKGPHPIFEREVNLYLLHKAKGAETFNDLRKAIKSLGKPIDVNNYEDGANRNYRCRIDYVDFKIYYTPGNSEIPELNVTQLSITKVPTTPIDLMKFSIQEITVEEYLLFEGENADRISFTDGITTIPEDVKKLFEAKKGLWVNHTHRKIGFTANGYCSIYSLSDITKITFVDSIGRYKASTEFRIILKNGTACTIFKDGDWSSYDKNNRNNISKMTGLPIDDHLVDNTYMDHDNWGSQENH